MFRELLLSPINDSKGLCLVDVPQQLQTPSPEFGARRVLPPTNAKCRIVDVDAADMNHPPSAACNLADGVLCSQRFLLVCLLLDTYAYWSQTREVPWLEVDLREAPGMLEWLQGYGLKQKIKEQSRTYINNNNYSVPIFYYPILNYEKYNNFIESLSSLLSNISIKNIDDYYSKYGNFKKIVLYYDDNKSIRKTKKRTKDFSVNIYLRNEESYNILTKFCDNLFIRNSI
jgi:hypothetical protein